MTGETVLAIVVEGGGASVPTVDAAVTVGWLFMFTLMALTVAAVGFMWLIAPSLGAGAPRLTTREFARLPAGRRDAVEAYKTVGIGFDGEQLTFRGVGAGRRITFAADASATCPWVKRILWHPRRPFDPTCQCGFYAWRSASQVGGEWAYAGRARAKVALYGQVVEHRGGWRAQHQRIVEIDLAACRCGHPSTHLMPQSRTQLAAPACDRCVTGEAIHLDEVARRLGVRITAKAAREQAARRTQLADESDARTFVAELIAEAARAQRPSDAGRLLLSHVWHLHAAVEQLSETTASHHLSALANLLAALGPGTLAGWDTTEPERVGALVGLCGTHARKLVAGTDSGQWMQLVGIAVDDRAGWEQMLHTVHGSWAGVTVDWWSHLPWFVRAQLPVRRLEQFIDALAGGDDELAVTLAAGMPDMDRLSIRLHAAAGPSLPAGLLPAERTGRQKLYEPVRWWSQLTDRSRSDHDKSRWATRVALLVARQRRPQL